MAISFRNCITVSIGSSLSTPTKTRSFSLNCFQTSFSRRGNSFLQTEHQLAVNYNTTTLPLKSVSVTFSPVVYSIVKFGAISPILTIYPRLSTPGFLTIFANKSLLSLSVRSCVSKSTSYNPNFIL